MVFCVHVGIDAVHEFVVVHGGVGAEEFVPEAEDVAEVGVCPRALHVLVELVHVGRDKDPAQGAVDPVGDDHVGVGKVGEKDDEEGEKKNDLNFYVKLLTYKNQNQ